MSKLEHEITLVLGDWSDDGHGKTEIVTIRSNKDSESLRKAYKKGSKKIGFNFIDDVCADYEDGSLPLDKLKILMEHGLTLEGLYNDSGYDIKLAKEALENEDESGVGLWTNSFTYIYMFICKLGDGNLVWEESEEHSRINIGGYGLFGS